MAHSLGPELRVSSTPPFRATQLWNEAVNVLQKGMPTRRHFHRMRYYDNCFSGKEAVEWLSQALINNPKFGNNVTTEGTRKLLQHFLKSGIFQSVKGTLTFKESGLYEFVNKTIHSPSRKQEKKFLVPQKCLKEINPNIPLDMRRLQEGSRKHRQFTVKEKPNHSFYYEDVPWKDLILKRIGSLLPTLGVELLLNPEIVSSDWVKVNVCPQYQSLRNNTELPFWVFTAVTSVIQRSESDTEYSTYFYGFEKDVYTVVRDYLSHRSCPVIPFCLYELFMYTFNHFHYLDLEIKNRLKEQNSVENLVLSMSNEWNNKQVVSDEELITTVLPPNSCFETAFTSDEPITRIVPQSCVDTICLSTTVSHTSISRPQTINRKNQEEIASRVTEPPAEKSFRNGSRLKRKYSSSLRRTQSMAHLDAEWNSLPRVEPQKYYVNYGLSQSMDDLALEDSLEGSLDLEEAMRSVHSLLRASTRSDSIDSNSISSLDSCRLDKADLICIDSCQWQEEIQNTARSVFQLLLMLLPPVSRTSLRMLLQFIDRLCIPLHSSITKSEMVYDLSAHILSPGPQSKNVYSHHMVLSVVYFLVDNCQHIFQELQLTELLNSNKEVDMPKEHKQTPVYCEQMTGDQYQDQGMTSSWLALAELLDQIISDTNMKSKEKKKRLKKFKEAYPHIYKQRLGSTSSPSMLHLR